MLLASDLINPAFVGPRDPDSMLAVEFYWGTVKKMGGQPVLEKDGSPRKIVSIRISVPGNETSMVDVPAREEHKRRFPRQWQAWQIQEQGDGGDIPGWKLDDWSELDEEMRRELKYLRFSVVEQIAASSDMQIQRIGANGPSLRMKAREALQKRAREAVEVEIKQRDDTIKSLQDNYAKLQEQINQLLAAKVPEKREKARSQE